MATATTSDVGFAIRDVLEGMMFSHYLDEGNGELIIEDKEPCFPIDHVDISDADNPVILLANGQRFTVRIIAGA